MVPVPSGFGMIEGHLLLLHATESAELVGHFRADLLVSE